MPDTAYRKQIYNFLKENYSDFTRAEDEFYKKLDTEPDYAATVHGLISNDFSDFTRPKEEFVSLMAGGVEKKSSDVSTSPSDLSSYTNRFIRAAKGEPYSEEYKPGGDGLIESEPGQPITEKRPSPAIKDVTPESNLAAAKKAIDDEVAAFAAKNPHPASLAMKSDEAEAKKRRLEDDYYYNSQEFKDNVRNVKKISEPAFAEIKKNIDNFPAISGAKNTISEKDVAAYIARNPNEGGDMKAVRSNLARERREKADDVIIPADVDWALGEYLKKEGITLSPEMKLMVREDMLSSARNYRTQKQIEDKVPEVAKKLGITLPDDKISEITSSIRRVNERYTEQFNDIKVSAKMAANKLLSEFQEVDKDLFAQQEAKALELQGLVQAGTISKEDAVKALDEIEKTRMANYNRYSARFQGDVQRSFTDLYEKTKAEYAKELSALTEMAKKQGIDVNGELKFTPEYEAKLKAVYDLSTRLVTSGEKRRTFEEWSNLSIPQKFRSALSSGVGDMIESVAGTFMNYGNYEFGQRIKMSAGKLQDEMPDPGEFTSASLVDPTWWYTRGARMLPFTLSLMAPAIATGAGVGALATAAKMGGFASLMAGSTSAALVSRMLESQMEAGGSFNDVIERGGSVEEARKQWSFVNAKNYNLLLSDVAQFGFLFSKGGLLLKSIEAAVGAHLEGAEEVYQEYINRKAQDGNTKFSEFVQTPIAREVFTLGAVNGLAFQGIGSANTAMEDAAKRRNLAFMLGDNPEFLGKRRQELYNAAEIARAHGIITQEEYIDALQSIKSVSSLMSIYKGLGADQKAIILENAHSINVIDDQIDKTEDKAQQDLLKKQRQVLMSNIEKVTLGTGVGYLVDGISLNKSDLRLLMNDEKFKMDVASNSRKVTIYNDTEMQSEVDDWMSGIIGKEEVPAEAQMQAEAKQSATSEEDIEMRRNKAVSRLKTQAGVPLDDINDYMISESGEILLGIKRSENNASYEGTSLQINGIVSVEQIKEMEQFVGKEKTVEFLVARLKEFNSRTESLLNQQYDNELKLFREKQGVATKAAEPAKAAPEDNASTESKNKEKYDAEKAKKEQALKDVDDEISALKEKRKKSLKAGQMVDEYRYDRKLSALQEKRAQIESGADLETLKERADSEKILSEESRTTIKKARKGSATEEEVTAALSEVKKTERSLKKDNTITPAQRKARREGLRDVIAELEDSVEQMKYAQEQASQAKSEPIEAEQKKASVEAMAVAAEDKEAFSPGAPIRVKYDKAVSAYNKAVAALGKEKISEEDAAKYKAEAEAQLAAMESALAELEQADMEEALNKADEAKKKADDLEKTGPGADAKNRTREAIKKSFNLDDKQADAAMAIFHNYAKAWARRRGKPVSEFYDNIKFAKKDKFSKATKNALKAVFGFSDNADELYQISGSKEYKKKKSSVGFKDTASFSTYQEALDGHGNLSQNNIYVRGGSGKTSGRTLAIQFSSEYLNELFKAIGSIGQNKVFNDYYNALYSKVPGYDRAIDFMEIPFWIADIAGSANGNMDMYIVREPEEAARFMSESGYSSITMSVMDVNIAMVEQLVKNNPTVQFYLGGYVDNMSDVFSKYENAHVFTSIKDGVEGLGYKHTGKYDYSMFKGISIIPRLKLSNGCKHKCAFCTVPKKVEPVPKEQIDQQVKALKGIKSRYVYLDDKTFGQADNYEYLIEVGNALAKQNPEFEGFIIQTTSAAIINMDRKDPEFFAKARIKLAEIGIETNNDKLLKELHKPNREKVNDLSASVLRERGVKFIPNIIIGIEGETRETYENTMDYIRRNSDIISHLNIYNLAIYEGTELAEKMGAKVEADRNEDILEKSFHSNPALHEEYYYKFFELATELVSKQSEDIIGSAQELLSEGEEVLASIVFGNNSEALITGYNKANILSFLHELGGHYMFEDIILVANDKNASKEARAAAKAELQSVVDMYNQNTGKSVTVDDLLADKEVYVGVHEMFAEGYEKWITLGDKSSFSASMKELFKKFTEWLKAFIERVKSNGIEITPEVEMIYQRITGIDTESVYQMGEPMAVNSKASFIGYLTDVSGMSKADAGKFANIVDAVAKENVKKNPGTTIEEWYAQNYKIAGMNIGATFVPSGASVPGVRNSANTIRFISSIMKKEGSARKAVSGAYFNAIVSSAKGGNKVGLDLAGKILDTYNRANRAKVTLEGLYGDSYDDIADFFDEMYGLNVKDNRFNRVQSGVVYSLAGTDSEELSTSRELADIYDDMRTFFVDAVSVATSNGVSLPGPVMAEARRAASLAGISEARYAANKAKASVAKKLFVSSSGLAKIGENSDWQIVAAFKEAEHNNPKSEKAQKAHRELRAKLDDLRLYGYDYMEIPGGMHKGISQGPAFVVLGLDLKSSMKLGVDFGQQSILSKEGIVYSDTGVYAPTSGEIFVGKDAVKKSKVDGYTIVDMGNDLVFAMDIDWSRRVRSGVKTMALSPNDIASLKVVNEKGVLISGSDGKFSIDKSVVQDNEVQFVNGEDVYPVHSDPAEVLDAAKANLESDLKASPSGRIRVYVPAGKVNEGRAHVLANKIADGLEGRANVKVSFEGIGDSSRPSYFIIDGTEKSPLVGSISSKVLQIIDNELPGAVPVVSRASMSAREKNIYAGALYRALITDMGYKTLISKDKSGKMTVVKAGDIQMSRPYSGPLFMAQTGANSGMSQDKLLDQMKLHGESIKNEEKRLKSMHVGNRVGFFIGRALFDTGFGLKYLSMKADGRGNLYKDIRRLVDARRHASSISSYEVAKAIENVFGKWYATGENKALSKNERNLLGRYLTLQRVIEIDTNYDRDGKPRPSHANSKLGVKLNKEIAQDQIALLESGSGYDIFGLPDNYNFDRIKNAAKQFKAEVDSALDKMYEENLISSQAYHKLKVDNQFYFKRVFMATVDDAASGSGSRSKAPAAEPITSLSEGADDMLWEDPVDVLASVISATNNKIYAARLGRAMKNLFSVHDTEFWGRNASYSKEFVDKMIKEYDERADAIANGIARQDKWIEPEFEKTPLGYEAVTFMNEAAQPQRIFLLKDIADEYNAGIRIGKHMSQIMEWVSWLVGAKVLKAFATGYNPEFFVRNLPLDVIHILLTGHELYGKSIFVGGAKLTKDMLSVLPDVLVRGPMTQRYYALGGYDNYLVKEGQFGQSEKPKTVLTGSVGAFLDTIAYTGTTSELLTRLSIMKRYLTNYERALGRSMTVSEREEAELQAVDAAINYLDFSQGGYFIKAVDKLVPYLNAGFQVTYGTLRAAKRDPLVMAGKLTELSIFSSLISGWNLGVFQLGLGAAASMLKGEPYDDDDKEKKAKNDVTARSVWYFNNMVSEQDKAGNWLVRTNYSYIDDKGQEHFILFKLPKDQSIQLITGLIDGAMWASFTGNKKYLLSSQRVKEAMALFRNLGALSTMPPLLRAYLNYDLEVDTYYNSKIWRGNDEVAPFVEYYADTPDMYKWIGKQTRTVDDKGEYGGLSPVRLQNAMQQLFTRNSLIYNGMEAIFSGAVAEPGVQAEVEKTGWWAIKEAPFARKIITATNFGQEQEKMQTFREISATKTQMLSNDIDAYLAKAETFNEVVSTTPGSPLMQIIEKYKVTDSTEVERAIAVAIAKSYKKANFDTRIIKMSSAPADAKAGYIYDAMRSAYSDKDRSAISVSVLFYPKFKTDEFWREFLRLDAEHKTDFMKYFRDAGMEKTPFEE